MFVDILIKFVVSLLSLIFVCMATIVVIVVIKELLNEREAKRNVHSVQGHRKR